MNESTELKKRSSFTMVSLVTVVAIVIVLIAVMMPAIQAAREGGRRTTCICHMKQAGLGFQNYASTYQHFPPSADVTISSGTASVTGWSFIVKLLPFTEYGAIYKSLNMNPTTSVQQLLAQNDPATVAASTTLIKDFICPSNGNRLYVSAGAGGRQDAFANVKAIGATTGASLVMCDGANHQPPYGTAKMHPDGAMFPGTGTPLAGFQKDGPSHTIVVMETQDDQYSRWVVGAECTMVGLPQSINATLVNNPATYPYYCPKMYDGKWGDEGAVARAGLRTFLEYDFSPTGADYGAYAANNDGDPGWDTTISNAKMYGPSVGHPGLVVVGFADGAAVGLSKRVDAANLFFLITRAGNDPFNLP